MSKRAHDRHHRLCQPAYRERDLFEFQLVRFQLGDIEDVVDDANKGVTGVADGLREFSLVFVQPCVDEQVGHAQNAVHGSANLMAHISQEAAFCLVGIL